MSDAPGPDHAEVIAVMREMVEARRRQLDYPTARIQPRNDVPLWARRYGRWLRSRAWSRPQAVLLIALTWLMVAPPLYAQVWWRGKWRKVDR